MDRILRKFVSLFLPTLVLFFGIAHAFDFPGYHGSGVSFAGGRFSDTTYDDMIYVSSDLVDSVFKGRSRWEPGAQQLHIRDSRKHEWIFTLDNPFMTLNGKVFNLTYPVRRSADAIYLPLHPMLRLLRSEFGIDLPLTKPKPIAVKKTPPKTETPIGADGEITGIDVEEKNNGTLVRVHVAGAPLWEGLRAPSLYLLKLTGGRLSPALSAKLKGKGPVHEVTTSQEDGLAQITLRLRGDSDSIEIFPDSTLPGFQITVRPSPMPPMGVRGAAAPAESIPLPLQKNRGTIIVDAGHGGHDRGAIVNGVEEAAITLAVARQLKIALENSGYTVRLTRETDEYKTLAERPKFASDQGGDVFVSLHCNSLSTTASDRKDVSGYTVYILREGESEEDKALARRENQAIMEESGKSGKKEIAPVDWMLLEHQLNLYSKQSESLAESIVKKFDGFDIPKYSTGARQAGFFVLVGAYMPAVLFEMGFLTHDQDRRILSSKSGQREIALRMAKAIDQFRRMKSQ